MTTAMTEYWLDVRDILEDAHLIAWDGCHKMYVAMDEEQATWFQKNYSPSDEDDTCMVAQGSPSFLFDTLKDWYENSCSLKFITAVETNHDDPNEGFITIIPQSADWYDEHEEYEN